MALSVGLGLAGGTGCAIGSDPSPFGPAATIGTDDDDDPTRPAPWDGDHGSTGDGGTGDGDTGDGSTGDPAFPGPDDEPPPPLDSGGSGEPPLDDGSTGDPPPDDPTGDPTDGPPPPDPTGADPTGDPPPPDEPWYGPCDASCTAPFTCLGTAYGQFCSGYCGPGSDPSACGLADEGTATPACLDTQSGQTACVLECSGGGTCPSGMTCVTITQAAGQLHVCT